MNLKANLMLPLIAQPVDKFGNAIPTAGLPFPVWSQTPEKGILQANGWEATFTPHGQLGNTLVKCAYDGKEGEQPITVVPGDIADVVIIPGAPVNPPA